MVNNWEGIENDPKVEDRWYKSISNDHFIVALSLHKTGFWLKDIAQNTGEEFLMGGGHHASDAVIF